MGARSSEAEVSVCSQQTGPSASAASNINGSFVLSQLLLPSNARSTSWLFDLKDNLKLLLAQGNVPWQLDARAAAGNIRFSGKSVSNSCMGVAL